MDVWKYEIISRVEQDISLVRFAHSWSTLEINFIFPHIHVLFSILLLKISFEYHRSLNTQELSDIWKSYQLLFFIILKVISNKINFILAS